jgi:hypothetical protein
MNEHASQHVRFEDAQDFLRLAASADEALAAGRLKTVIGGLGVRRGPGVEILVLSAVVAQGYLPP